MAKTLINNADDCVKDFLKGIKVTYPGLSVDIESQIVLLNRNRGNKVAVVSGGGSGHEPFGAGYVGENMLTGVIIGSIFASPPSKMIYKGMLNLIPQNKGGILVLIMDYTGDRLNFGMAIEKMKKNGFMIDSVIVSDDCAIMIKNGLDAVGGRGCSGIALISKIIGAMSSNAMDLHTLKKEAEEINSRMFTLSAAIEPCTLPGNAEPLWKLNSGQVEIGVGVHGEKGIQTIQLSSTKDLIKMMIHNIENVIQFKSNQSYVILINNLGNCTDLEMYYIAHEINTQISEKWHITLERFYVGKMMSSVDMKGIQITVFNVTDKPEWLSHLDTTTEAFGWPFTSLTYNKALPHDFIDDNNERQHSQGLMLNDKEVVLFKKIISEVCQSFEKSEIKLNQLDSGCGDGDCGSCLKRLGLGITNQIETWPLKNISQTLFSMSDVAETCMGGTSGALYSLMFIGAANNAHDYPSMWKGALEMLQRYSKAEVGHRTMVDALIPGYEAFIEEYNKDPIKALNSAVEKAEQGCKATENMTPRFSRASFVDKSAIKDMDAGAYGVLVWLKAIQSAISKYESVKLRYNAYPGTEEKEVKKDPIIRKK